jgi:hypothetical protein
MPHGMPWTLLSMSALNFLRAGGMKAFKAWAMAGAMLLTVL